MMEPNHSIAIMWKMPNIVCKPCNGTFRTELIPDIGLYAWGKDVYESIKNFLNYLLDLVIRLGDDREKGLTAHMENIFNFLLDYYKYYDNNGVIVEKRPYREPEKWHGRILLTEDDMKYLNPPYPPEEDYEKE